MSGVSKTDVREMGTLPLGKWGRFPGQTGTLPF
jgi:hypothetical protein